MCKISALYSIYFSSYIYIYKTRSILLGKPLRKYANIFSIVGFVDSSECANLNANNTQFNKDFPTIFLQVVV